MSTSFITREARREGAKVVVALAGTSGSGKTYTAIMLAYGLAGYDGSKVGFLDTENKRGSLYADILPDGQRFKIADFIAPFSPDRYVEGIRHFENEGVRVLVIDSLSHEWEGPGGCEDIANEGVVWPKPPRWNLAKLHHKKMMNALLQSSMDIVVCFRAREKVDMKDPKKPVNLGLQAITEKNVMFEMTASVMMHDEGRAQGVIKCPEALRDILGRGKGYITAQDGEKLRQWIDGGTPVDREADHARAVLAAAAENGTDALSTAWASLTGSEKRKLKDELTQYKEAASGYDKQLAIVGEERGEA